MHAPGERDAYGRGLGELVGDLASFDPHAADRRRGRVARALGRLLARARILGLVAEAVAVGVGLDRRLHQQLADGIRSMNARQPRRRAAGQIRSSACRRPASTRRPAGPDALIARCWPWVTGRRASKALIGTTPRASSSFSVEVSRTVGPLPWALAVARFGPSPSSTGCTSATRRVTSTGVAPTFARMRNLVITPVIGDPRLESCPSAGALTKAATVHGPSVSHTVCSGSWMKPLPKICAPGAAAGRARARSATAKAASGLRSHAPGIRSPRPLGSALADAAHLGEDGGHAAVGALLVGDHVRDGVDQRQVGEGLGEVAEVPAASPRRAPRRRGRATRPPRAAARRVRGRVRPRRSPRAPRPARRSRSGRSPPCRCRPSSVSSTL